MEYDEEYLDMGVVMIREQYHVGDHVGTSTRFRTELEFWGRVTLLGRVAPIWQVTRAPRPSRTDPGPRRWLHRRQCTRRRRFCIFGVCERERGKCA